MGKYIGKRLLSMIPVLFGVVTLVFFMLHFAPGDPARTVLGESATEADLVQQREEMGLNDPILVQYGRFLTEIVHGDFGTSYLTGRPVGDEILQRFPTTMLLTILPILVMIIIGIPTGIISAIKQYSWMDKTCMVIALTGISMPTFCTGMLLTLAFSLNLHIFPPSGFYGPIYWVLPSITIGFGAVALLTRMTRSSMLEVIRQDYIRTARAKGQTENKIIMHHALKNALIPIITVIGLQAGVQLGGAMVTESLFAIPGLGNFMLEAIKGRNYPVVQGGVLFIAFTFCILNLLIDVIYAFVDPRIKAQYKAGKKVKVKKQ
ncbi:ABC transporter permease [Butyricicoccus faecihominis]|uniref:ABC transporter permease n=1 Tax=Butyricicoccus faecihominis TaxID=1712515 RepID=UPI002478D06D|nr:ABC transporter permease [Butyricicoccus faecihominis]MCQ5130591.1 ABC transporter permease [Butyricicoccus faecihominis]